jgi:MoCo/4Fe-4S cofactor protein with predicted Tat translocation signal
MSDAVHPTHLTVASEDAAAVDAPAIDLAAVRERVRERIAERKGAEYWRSLDELADTVEFQEFLRKEFPRQAAPLEASLDRRDFLKLLGASLALGGLSACARPPQPHEKIVPYVRAPEDHVPGRPEFYATAVLDGGYAEGVLAENHEGRPTRVEGNPDHPASLGAAHAITSATVLSLYDPDRSQQLLQGGSPRSWSQFAGAMAERLAALPDGSRLRLLTETITSPTLAGQIRELLAAHPGARWHQWDPLHADGAVAGLRALFGEDVAPVYDFRRADVVVSFGADFTQVGPGRLRYAKDFARRRRVRSADDDMNRLWQVESTPTPTGTLADHRLALAPADIAALAAVVAGEMGIAGAPAATLPARASRAWVDALLADLRAHAGRSIVIAGADQPAAVHALAHALNVELGNVGETVRYVAPPTAAPAEHAQDLRELVADLRTGAVDLLVIIGANPVFTAPADLGFAEALARAGTSVHLGEQLDETARLARWHVPRTHTLEAWGDARAFDGSVTIQQPLFAPFYGGKSDLELLEALLGRPERSGYEVIRDAWRERVSGDFETFWRRTLHLGVVENSAAPERSVAPRALDLTLPAGDDLVVHFHADHGLADGRHANNGWLQELPRPFSKLTWDNAAILAPATAERLDVRSHDRLALRVDGTEVVLPVWVQPGQAHDVIGVALGFGRTAAGRVGDGVGADVYPLRTSAQAWSRPVSAERVRGRHRLATTQTHHSLEGTGERRYIVRAGTLGELKAEPEHPKFVHPVTHPVSDIIPDWKYEGYAWGMVIDMTVCTGCNACVTACQSENNVPIVGKEQVIIGREMHWIRVDAYYKGDLDDPEFYNMPVACQHCEKAPCEPVCPVAATVHDAEGLNVMVYNRCVGTRYCANNCPYKVRRYNYLQFAELAVNASELSLAHNPDVTVRSRGVMEKCTYCTQRISAARIQAGNEGRRIRDGEVVTACQSACPSEAIVFGDLNDPESAVVAAKASVLDYKLLEELNTVPRTSYLARVGNPHPDVASASRPVASASRPVASASRTGSEGVL